MMRSVYENEKMALSDLRVVLGYSKASVLSDAAREKLALARKRLGALTGGEAVDLMVQMHLSSLGPESPPR